MVAVDLRGFGETGGKPGDVYDVGCAAQDVARIIVRRVLCSLPNLQLNWELGGAKIPSLIRLWP